jgi:alkanesulfonate monooxygenase SsuD/methylene tetrahydromethanopterin reductase-like flavin-dependent oxidoreductase (luciferase family)
MSALDHSRRFWHVCGTSAYLPIATAGYPFVGSPDRIATELADLSRSGVRAIAFSMINYLNELPLFRDEVLPRLERLGVRTAHN